MSGLRRLLRDLGSVLLLAGLLMLLDAGVTLVWQEPVTAVIALVQRSSLDQRYLTLRAVPLGPGDRIAMRSLTTLRERIAFVARREAAAVPDGAAIGRLVIARLQSSYDVVQGTDAASLELGPGHYPSTPFPGEGGTVAIAGHRTTYLAPFRDLDELHPGDRLVLRMPYATFLYRVQGKRIVSPSAWWITRDVGYERLVLSACNPLYSAAQRIVVFARLAAVFPNLRALTL